MVHVNTVAGLGGDEVFGKAVDAGTSSSEEQVQYYY
jgi:hypothetical protein